MWIKKIKIENLCSFENAEIEFSKGNNTLLDANINNIRKKAEGLL